jgi:hypothetical protein
LALPLRAGPAGCPISDVVVEPKERVDDWDKGASSGGDALACRAI